MLANENNDQLCKMLLDGIVPRSDVLIKDLAPEGWHNSPLFLLFHPTPEQQYQEALHFHKRSLELAKLFRKKSSKLPKKSPPPNRSDFIEPEQPEKTEPEKEVILLLGLCLWDILAGHDVITKEGEKFNFGSQRATAGFIADYFNKSALVSGEHYDYLDFYMGTIWIKERADIMPVYKWIFQKMKAMGYEWEYYFPRLNAISPDELKENLGLEDDQPTDYDPHKAALEALEKKERKVQSSKLRKEIDEIFKKSIHEAKHKPLPRLIRAYKHVYGELPEGWPYK